MLTATALIQTRLTIIKTRHTKTLGEFKTISMIPVIKKLLFSCIYLLLYVTVTAQPVYSDISISAMSVTAAGPLQKTSGISNSINNHSTVVTAASADILKCSVTVNNVSSANAFGAKLIVVLPAEVTIPAGSLPSNGTLVSERVATGGGPAYIEFNLQAVFANQPVTVEFKFNKSKYINKLSAFVVSGVPDTNASNNYKDAAF
jgi:hypothetical protein